MLAKTNFAGANPWTGLPGTEMPKPQPKSRAILGVAGTDKPKQRGGKPRANVEAMRVEFDRPLPHGRSVPIGGFYAHLFEKMRPKACIVCDPKEVYAVASAMRTWIRRQGKTHLWSTRTELRSDADGKGRVWCWPEPPPLKGKR